MLKSASWTENLIMQNIAVIPYFICEINLIPCHWLAEVSQSQGTYSFLCLTSLSPALREKGLKVEMRKKEKFVRPLKVWKTATSLITLE